MKLIDDVFNELYNIGFYSENENVIIIENLGDVNSYVIINF